MSSEREITTQDSPPLEKLPEEGPRLIHEASMEILENTGIKVEHEKAREILRKNGAEVNDKKNIVKVSENVIEKYIDKAPSSFTLHSRNSDRKKKCGDGGRVRAPGYGAPMVKTFRNGRRSALLSDYQDLVKLAHMEDVIDCLGHNLCEPDDVNEETKHLEMMKTAILYSDKPPMGSTLGEKRAQECIDIVSIAVDDPDMSKPYMAGLVNTVPPLRLGKEMTGGMISLAKNGQASIVSSMSLSGASSPATYSGTLAQANAEVLMGIAIAQMVNPGSPVVYGLPTSNIDMRSGSFSIGSPASGLFISLAAQMARYYGIPSRAGGSLTDSKTVDYQAGSESMLELLISHLSKINYMLHSCGIIDSYFTMSPEKFVLDCDMIRKIDWFEDGFKINEDTLALDIISEVGPGGNFIGQKHTRTYFQKEYFTSEIDGREPHSDWKGAGKKTFFEKGRERVEKLLSDYEKPEIAKDKKKDIENYVEK